MDNEFQLIGHLTRDADFRQTAGSAMAFLDLAVNRAWLDGTGAKKEATDFFRLKCFGPAAENARKYLGKGSHIIVQGRLEPTKYDKGGETQYGLDLVADRVKYLNTKAPEAPAEQ